MQLKKPPARLFSGGLKTVPYGRPGAALEGQTRICPFSHETRLVSVHKDAYFSAFTITCPWCKGP